VIAQSLPKIPSLPPIDKVKPLALEKVCPTCSSDNTPTAVVCANCGADIAKIRALPKQRKRDQQGEQKGQNPKTPKPQNPKTPKPLKLNSCFTFKGGIFSLS
jgi:ribosomal protein L40E